MASRGRAAARSWQAGRTIALGRPYVQAHAYAHAHAYTLVRHLSGKTPRRAPSTSLDMTAVLKVVREMRDTVVANENEMVRERARRLERTARRIAAASSKEAQGVLARMDKAGGAGSGTGTRTGTGTGTGTGRRAFSTSTRQSDLHRMAIKATPDSFVVSQDPLRPSLGGHTIALPQRTDPIIEQIVNNIMKSGRKSQAQRHVAIALFEIRRQTHHPNVVGLVHEAIEKVSPIVRMVAFKKFSKVNPTPMPLNDRQRHRRAILWILEASDSRKYDTELGIRLAHEILAVINGSSPALAKKAEVHRLALTNRSNVPLGPTKGRGL